MLMGGKSQETSLITIAGMIAVYFATSLAMLNVVSELRVMSSCFPILMISISFVGSESRSTILLAFGGLRAGIHGYADVSLGKRAIRN